MEKVGSFDLYRSNYYDKAAQVKKEAETAAAAKTKKTGASKNKVELSRSAQNLLKELKKSYGNMDFIVADYETDEEAASYLSRGAGEYSVLITPEELEKMAADEDVKNKNLKTLDDAVSQLKAMKDKLGDKADQVTRLGVAIGDDGSVSYFAELEKVSEKQRERIDRQRAEKKEAAAEEAKKAEAKREEGPEKTYSHAKRTTVYAGSVDELMDKIGKVDWNTVKEGAQANGQRFDLTV